MPKTHRLLALFSLAILSFGFIESVAAIHSIGPTKSSINLSIEPTIILHRMNPPTVAPAPFPETMDFKKQEIPKNIPPLPPSATMPNFDPLIDQLMRHGELSSYATKLMPWVYTTTAESVVADFEEAVMRLDFAEKCLLHAMRNALYESGSLETDPMLARATVEIDNAEFTIVLLLEIAKLEL